MSAKARANDTFARTMGGLGRLVDAITPWLLDLGGWIFGGLIAFNLIVLGALLTVGPVDVAVKVSTASFAAALPLDIAGFVLLRLIADIKKLSVGEVAANAFIEEGFRVENAESAPSAEANQRGVALLYSYALLSVAVILTLAGVTAALWHMGWWIGVLFVVMVAVATAVILAALTGLLPKGRWRTPGGETEGLGRPR